MTEVIMQQWVIYDHPSDFPFHFVVRCWEMTISGGKRSDGFAVTPEVWLRDSVEGARDLIAANFPDGYRLDRQPDDDPKIVEVWV